MWPAIFDFLQVTMAVFCTAAAVKLVDDYLDQERDGRSGQLNWTVLLGNAAPIYALLCLAIGASLHTISLPLFLASYIIGMFNDLRQHFPSKLTGWQESILLFIVGWITWGWHIMWLALLFILAVQLIDDCCDFALDQQAGYRNLAHRFGLIECLLAAVSLILLAWAIEETLLPPLVSGTITFYVVTIWLERKHLPC